MLSYDLTNGMNSAKNPIKMVRSIRFLVFIGAKVSDPKGLQADSVWFLIWNNVEVDQHDPH